MAVTTTVTVTGHKFTLGMLRQAVKEAAGMPDDAVVDVRHYAGDQRDRTDSSSTTLTVTGVARPKAGVGSWTSHPPEVRSSIGEQRDGDNYYGPYGMGTPQWDR